jgi:hypothetical protein
MNECSAVGILGLASIGGRSPCNRAPLAISPPVGIMPSCIALSPKDVPAGPLLPASHPSAQYRRPEAAAAAKPGTCRRADALAASTPDASDLAKAIAIAVTILNLFAARILNMQDPRTRFHLGLQKGGVGSWGGGTISGLPLRNFGSPTGMAARKVFLLACVALLIGSVDAFLGGSSAVPSAPAVQLKAQPKNPLLFQINTVCDPDPQYGAPPQREARRAGTDTGATPLRRESSSAS